MTKIITIFSIFGASLLSWLILAGYFLISQNLSRITFIFLHYLTAIGATALFFFILYKYLPHFTPFYTMVTAMISLFIIEFIVFKYIYKGELWFLNFIDWMVPAFLIATTIYLIGYLLG